MEDMLKDFFGDVLDFKQLFPTRIYESIYRVQNEDTKLTYEISLPGYEKEDLDIRIEDTHLIIESKFDKEDGWRKKFIKRAILPKNLDLDGATATMKSGILYVTFNKKAGLNKKIILN